MEITALRLSNFQSFGPAPTEIRLHELTYVLGPNGSGKTAVLEALSRLFSPVFPQRKIRNGDFHVASQPMSGDKDERAPTLWLEVDSEFPEACAETGEQHASIPPNFEHMTIESEDAVPTVRVRLTAELAIDGIIDEKIEYVLDADGTGRPTKTSNMSRHDRAFIEVHYLPARRDPAEHIAFTAASLLGRTLRAADWTSEREALLALGAELSDALTENDAVASIGAGLATEWKGLHSGAYFSDPAITFGKGELESVLRQLTLTFSPTHGGTPLPFERLSDGQKSLLYISLVLAWQALTRRVLAGEEKSVDSELLRPPVHTVIALEEPENSLAPHYLGRVIRQLKQACTHGDVQALVATHAPVLLRRVEPETICFLRLNSARESTVRRIALPEDDDLAAKYVREAVQAYPELYFSRFVVLGEGDSEQVVLPRVLSAAGIAEDDASISVVPLGGRHVNHFWRLLNELGIPHATLLDLDAGRHQGGWGRVRNAFNQLRKVQPGTIDGEFVAGLPAWNEDLDFPVVDASAPEDTSAGALSRLEQIGVFFSHPVDLDLMMLEAFPLAYESSSSVAAWSAGPDPKAVAAVLGKLSQEI